MEVQPYAFTTKVREGEKGVVARGVMSRGNVRRGGGGGRCWLFIYRQKQGKAGLWKDGLGGGWCKVIKKQVRESTEGGTVLEGKEGLLLGMAWLNGLDWLEAYRGRGKGSC